MSKACTVFDRMGNIAIGLNNIFQLTKSVVGSVTNAFNNCVQANQAQQEAETKLARVMRNTMAASDEQIESIKALTSAQHQKKCSRTNMWWAPRSSSAAAAVAAKLSWGAE